LYNLCVGPNNTDTKPRPEEPKMTSLDVIKIAAIKAILEAIQCDDEEDAKQAMKLIKGIIGGTAEK
jgi:hypothetical protein